jgi:hypothetical protein
MQSVAKRDRPNAVTATRVDAGRSTRAHRVTVDLDDTEYLTLRNHATNWFVSGSAVLRALLAEMSEDGELAERIAARVHD